MEYLLDTHVLLWRIQDSDRLSEHAVELIKNGSNELFEARPVPGKLRFSVPFGDGGNPSPSGEAKFDVHDFLTIPGLLHEM